MTVRNCVLGAGEGLRSLGHFGPHACGCACSLCVYAHGSMGIIEMSVVLPTDPHDH